MPTNVLITAKTNVPELPKNATERQRLTDMLKQASTSRLIVVRAPAGYGKTTMLSHWAKQMEQAVAWYSVNQEDNDPIRFWKYFTASICQALQLNSMQYLWELPHVQPQPPVKFLVNALLTELYESNEPIQIVIDDYHVIHNEAIHEMLKLLIDFMPSHCSICIASRTSLSLPIAKWRLIFRVVEIGREQLLFTFEEAKKFYNERNIIFKRLETVQAMLNMTESWVMGLLLTTIAMKDDEDGQFHRNALVMEYLMKEVLETLPLDIQQFLLYTSILEQLTPEVCDALANRSDSFRVLSMLEQQGVFVIRMESKNPVFRYHNLMLETLQRELQSSYSEEFIRALYEKASTTLFEKGNILSAIELALNGKLFAKAEQWIRENMVRLLSCGQSTTYVVWIRTMLDNRYEVHPEMMVMYAYTLATLHNLQDALAVIQELEQRHKEHQWMTQEEYATAVDDFLGIKAYILVMLNGDLVQGAQYIQRRLERKPKNSKWDAIFTQYNQQEPVLSRTNIGSKGKLISDEKAMSFFSLFRTGEFKELSMTGYSYGVRAEKLYEWNRFDELMLELEEALKAGYRFRDQGLLVPMYILKSKVLARNHPHIVAQTVLDHALENVSEKRWKDALHTMKALLFVRNQELDKAENELLKTGESYVTKTTLHEIPFYELVTVRILLAKEQYEKALAIILRVKKQAQQQQQLSTNIEAIVLEAICYSRLNKREQSLQALHEALRLGEPYGYVRTFLDESEIQPILESYVTRRQQDTSNEWHDVSIHYVLQLLDKEQKQQSLIDSLTPREQEMYALLIEGVSNKEIAARLFLSEGTVRVYLSGIYQKLGVKNRAQAMSLHIN